MNTITIQNTPPSYRGITLYEGGGSGGSINSGVGGSDGGSTKLLPSVDSQVFTTNNTNKQLDYQPFTPGVIDTTNDNIYIGDGGAGGTLFSDKQYGNPNVVPSPYPTSYPAFQDIPTDKVNNGMTVKDFLDVIEKSRKEGLSDGVFTPVQPITEQEVESEETVNEYVPNKRRKLKLGD